jgi:hypothetical protein
MTTVKINGRELLLKECPECHREVISLLREFHDGRSRAEPGGSSARLSTKTSH